MRPATVTVGAQEASAPIFLNWQAQDFNATISAEISAGGALTYSLQYTLDNVLRPGVTPVWTDITDATGKTANFRVGLEQPVVAVRANVTAYTGGTLTLKALQGRG